MSPTTSDCHWRLRISFSFLASLVLGLSTKADLVDDTVDALMQKLGIPGFSLAIIQDDQIVKARGYGIKEKGKPDPVTTETLFQAGALSQPVAAVGSLSLVEKGRLSLDADVNSMLTTWHVPENEFTTSSKVTLRRLLSHHAGLSVPSFPGYNPDDQIPSLAQVLTGEKPAKSRPILVESEPGGSLHYSSGGYAVVEQLVTDTTAQPFAAYMETNVLRPLGMTSSTFEQPLSIGHLTEAATAHPQRSTPLVGGSCIYPELAATGLWTTPTDAARFIITMQRAYAGETVPVISTKMAWEISTHQRDNFGLGFIFVGDGKTAKFFNSNTPTVGYFATALGTLASRQGVVIMANSDRGVDTKDLMIATVAYVYNWPDYQLLKDSMSRDGKEPLVAKQVRSVLEQVKAGKLDFDLFASESAQESTDEFMMRFQTKLKKSGALNSMVPIWWNRDANNPEYCYLVIFEKRVIIINCECGRNAEIIRIRVA